MEEIGNGGYKDPHERDWKGGVKEKEERGGRGRGRGRGRERERERGRGRARAREGESPCELQPISRLRDQSSRGCLAKSGSGMAPSRSIRFLFGIIDSLRVRAGLMGKGKGNRSL